MDGRVLIIEDEIELGELIQLFLKKDGIQSDLYPSAEEGLIILKKQVYDLIILDINLPGMDGFEFLQILRRNSAVGVIILSAREADEDIVLGLGLGADEFVTKPFAPKVLVARVRALLRRFKAQKGNVSGRIYFGPFEMDIGGYSVVKEGDRVPLSTKEFEVLRFLIENAGKVFTPPEIYQAVWKQEFGDVTSVAVYIQRLRKKLEPDPAAPELLITVRGKGYLCNKKMVTYES